MKPALICCGGAELESSCLNLRAHFDLLNEAELLGYAPPLLDRVYRVQAHARATAVSEALQPEGPLWRCFPDLHGEWLEISAAVAAAASSGYHKHIQLAAAVRACVRQRDVRAVLAGRNGDSPTSRTIVASARRLSLPVVDAGQLLECNLSGLLDSMPKIEEAEKRFYEFERLLASATPPLAHNILVIGAGGEAIRDELIDEAPTRNVVQHAFDAADYDRYHAVILTEPLPHSAGADRRLKIARDRLAPGGALLACCFNGQTAEAGHAVIAGYWTPPFEGGVIADNVGAFSEAGVQLLFSRRGFDAIEWFPLEPFMGDGNNAGDSLWSQGWVLRARCDANPSERARTRIENLKRAAADNKRGESEYAQGRLSEAIAAFAAAVTAAPGEALYRNNLAVALAGTQHAEDAWRQIVEALHADPNLPLTRANARMIAHAQKRDDEIEEILALFGKD